MIRNYCKAVCVLAALSVAACDRPAPVPAATADSANADPPSAILQTSDLPPVIRLDDLVPLGFDTTTLYLIEPSFHLLNGALVTLAELKSSYDRSTDAAERTRLNRYAVPFHITADTHQRAILTQLAPPSDSVFDRYVESRKRAVGLTDWHVDHRRQRPATELPGLAPGVQPDTN
jgi:hypothetical protein